MHVTHETADVAAVTLRAGFGAALIEAGNARHRLFTQAHALVAHLIRTDLPDAAFLTVDTREREAYAVSDAQGKQLWAAPFTPVRDLRDATVEHIDDLLGRLIPFGRLEAEGWKTSALGEPYMDIRLPDLITTGQATAHCAIDGHLAAVKVTVTPGPAAFRIHGIDHPRETSDRIRAGLINSGYTLPDGQVSVTVTGPTARRIHSGLDLAIAVGALAAAGTVNPEALNGITFYGEIGLNGFLRDTVGARNAVHASVMNGRHHVMLPDASSGQVVGLRIGRDVRLRTFVCLPDVIDALNAR